jgi:hypothetical protein
MPTRTLAHGAGHPADRGAQPVNTLPCRRGRTAARLINLANLSGQGGPGHTGGEIGSIISVPQGPGVLTQPAVWVNPSDGATWTLSPAATAFRD